MSCEHIHDAAGNLVAVITTNTEPEEFARKRVVAVGFGGAGLYRDGELLIDGEERLESELGELTGEECEAIAAAAPEHVWEIRIDGAMSGGTYRRDGKDIGRWICVEQTGGFA